MRVCINTQVIIWVNTILNHIDTRAIWPRYEGSCMVYTPIGKKISSNIHIILVSEM